MGNPNPSPEESEVVIDLSDGPHCRAGVSANGLLFDGDGWREALYGIYVGLLHEAQELPSIGGEGFHVPTLAFGIDGVESQGGFARTGEAGDDHQLLTGEFQIDVLEVVLPGTTDNQRFSSHSQEE
jgi:hypothetical protein